MSSAHKNDDMSNGWEANAHEFLSYPRTNFGVSVMEHWCNLFRAEQTILDIGCGFGGGYTQTLIDKRLKLYAIDASKTLLNEYAKTFPNVTVKCEAAESSNFFGKKFDGILSIGFIFLLAGEKQRLVLEKMATALNKGGRLLFTSPYQIHEWNDLTTGKISQSLGRDVYLKILQEQGFSLIDEYTNEGNNHYYDFQKQD